jgi:hypothetical protein
VANYQSPVVTIYLLPIYLLPIYLLLKRRAIHGIVDYGKRFERL